MAEKLGEIAWSNTRVEAVSLSRSENRALEAVFSDEPQFDAVYSFESYIDEKRGTEASLREALASLWNTPADFEVGDDENFAFTMCGVIYSQHLMCRDYLEIVHRALRGMRMPDKWIYSTAIELPTPIEGVQLSSFIMHRNAIYADFFGGRFDFLKYFSRTREEAAS